MSPLEKLESNDMRHMDVEASPSDSQDAPSPANIDQDQEMKAPLPADSSEDSPEEKVDPPGEKDEDFSNDSPSILLPHRQLPNSFCLNDKDVSFNALASQDRQMVLCLPGDNFNQLYSSVRGNYGVVKNRYYLELKFIDMPKCVRLGFTVLSEGLTLLGPHSFGFTSDGEAISSGAKLPPFSPKFAKTDIVGVLLNLPKKQLQLSVNGTLVENGVINIPDEMFIEGSENCLKPEFSLFPTIETKGATVAVNFSSKIWKDLPFKVRPLGLARKEDVVGSTIGRAKETLRSKQDKEHQTVDVYVPIGFETTRIIDGWKKTHPEGDGVVLSPDTLDMWAEKSDVKSRQSGQQQANQRAADAGIMTKHYGLVCLDNPLGIFPIMLRGNGKYMLSCFRKTSDHPLLKNARAQLVARCRHATNAKLKAIVDVDSFIQAKSVTGLLRDEYEKLSLPSADEGFDSISYVFNGEEVTMESNPELTETTGKIAHDKFGEWKKDCKLKSRVQDLKRGTYYGSFMKKFGLAKSLTHKGSYEKSRLAAEREREAKKKEEAAAVEAAKKKEEAAAAAEAKDSDDSPDETKSEPVTPKTPKPVTVEVITTLKSEDDPFPEPVINFTEEDWMLATLRAEMIAVMHSFRIDVNDPERQAFAAIHFPYYYQFYTGKNFTSTLHQYGCKNLQDLTHLVPDVVKHLSSFKEVEVRKMVREGKANLADYALIEPALEEDVETLFLIKTTEEQRLKRVNRLLAGDENASLNFRNISHQGAYGYGRATGGQNGQQRSAPYRR